MICSNWNSQSWKECLKTAISWDWCPPAQKCITFGKKVAYIANYDTNVHQKRGLGPFVNLRASNIYFIAAQKAPSVVPKSLNRRKTGQICMQVVRTNHVHCHQLQHQSTVKNWTYCSTSKVCWTLEQWNKKLYPIEYVLHIFEAYKTGVYTKEQTMTVISMLFVRSLLQIFWRTSDWILRPH